MEKNLPVQAGFLIPVFCLSLVLIIFFDTIRFPRFFGTEWVAGFIIQIALVCFGRILVFTHRDIVVEQSACFSNNQSNCLLLQILTDPVSKQNSYKSVATVRWLIKDQTCFNENEKLLVYFSRKTDVRQISTGSWILVKKLLKPIENFEGSGFDYKKYCHLRHIYAQVFLRENEFAPIHHDFEKPIFTLLDSLRKKLLIIIKSRLSKSESGLLEALMVGFSDDLDPALLKSYADTGVIHIIAISGLHLALICHILQLCLKRVGQKKTSAWVKYILLVSCLWSYSFLSGASPSVIRSAVMFSLVLFAGNISREAVLYNTLAASAFLLICFDPNWLWDTGFQLSYAAVFSLGLFSNPVREIFHFQNKILIILWNAASVSIAAQILTTPVSIYYFHQFPSYFLIANLLAVPLSSAILLGGILFCSFYWIPVAGHFFGWLLGLMISLLNGIIQHIARLPGAVIPNLSITGSQLILIYFFLFCIYRFLKMKERPWLITAMAVICIFQTLRLMQ